MLLTFNKNIMFLLKNPSIFTPHFAHDNNIKSVVSQILLNIISEHISYH